MPTRPCAIVLIGLITLSSCGGGSDSEGGPGGFGLSFSTIWEQSGSGTARSPRSFGTAIPPSVETVRIIMEPQGDGPTPACCIAVRRGSTAFETRTLLLDDIAVGPIELRINGFYDDFAPDDGIGATCPTIPEDAGQPCDATREAFPTHSSDANLVDVAPGVITDAGDVLIFSVPFPLETSPEPNEPVLRPDVPIRIQIVDAAHTIDPDFEIEVLAGEPPSTFAVAIESVTPCDDNSGGPSDDCTTAGSRELEGITIEGRSAPIPDGPARVSVRASNTGSPARELDASYDILVAATTTTTSTTSTTMVPGCLVTISVDDTVDLTSLLAELDYSAANANLAGTADSAACTPLLPDTFLTTFNDEDASRLLNIAIAGATAFSGPVDIAECEFIGAVPSEEEFSIEATEANDENFEPIEIGLSVSVGNCDR